MKKRELEELIRKTVRETLYAGPGAVAKAKMDPDYSKVKDKVAIDNTLRAGGSVELEEKDYTDPDDEVREGVLDIDGDGTDFKDYDSVYERMQKLIKYKG
jgi:hypothetical protein